MIGQQQGRQLLLAAALTAVIAAGCGTATPAATKTGPTPVPVTPIVGGDKVALQTLVPANALSDLEVAAAGRGVATYTGYACTIAPAGCACEAPLVQQSSFTFTPQNQLMYDFTVKGGKPSQWQLDHSGVNQWSYTAPVSLTGDQQDALLLALLTFTQDGYEVTEVATFRTGEVAKCDNVQFHRLDSPTP